MRPSRPEIIGESLAKEKLEPLFAKAEELLTTLRAERVQFILSMDGRWNLNYLLTKDGKVIGTVQNFQKRTRHLVTSDSGPLECAGWATLEGSLWRAPSIYPRSR